MNIDKVLDDAREKIAKELYWQSFCDKDSVKDIDALWKGMRIDWRNKWLEKADQALAISGTTDIECPECGGESYIHPVSVCKGPGKVTYKWKVSVTLENGELPQNPLSSHKDHDHEAGYYSAHEAYDLAQEDMAKYRQVVE